MNYYDDYGYQEGFYEDDYYEYNHEPQHSRPADNAELVTSTIALRGMPTSITERDIRYALEDERARYVEIRLVKDKKSGISKGKAFVDFYTQDDAWHFMKNCHAELDIRGYAIKMSFSTPRDDREEELYQQKSSYSSNNSDRKEEYSSTILMRGLPSANDERDVRDVLDRTNVNYVDVRIIRDKITGISRGFGFIEFASVLEARQWMDNQKGILRVRRNDLRLMYSSPRHTQLSSRPGEHSSYAGRPTIPALSSRSGPPNDVNMGDWICSRCSSHNFRRRDQCYRCQLPRSKSQKVTCSSDGSDLIGAAPCNTLIIRCLDTLTTEDIIIQAFKDTADVAVRQCHIMRDDETHISRSFAFVELSTVADAYKVVETIVKEHKLFEIEGKAVAVSYARNTFNTIMATLKAEGSYIPKPNMNNSPISDQSSAPPEVLDSIAQNALAAGHYTNLLSLGGVAVAQAAIQQKQTEAQLASVIAKSIHQSSEPASQKPVGAATFPLPTMPFNAATAATTAYPFPDTTQFVYDESIRYYYDPITGLLYEPNTRYFFDRVTQAYFFYDASRSIYIPAEQAAAMANALAMQTASGSADQNSKSADDGEPVKKKDKEKKEKTAKKIAKEMEKWAKRMNSHKEAIATVNRSDTANTEISRTADTGYAILQAAAAPAPQQPPASVSTAGLVAHYGGDEDSDESNHEEQTGSFNELESQASAEESKLMDWAKLACLLCSRGFKDVETMQKHRSFSNLHIQNFNKLRSKYGLKPLSTSSASSTAATTKTDQSASQPITVESLMQIGAATASSHVKNAATRPNSGAPSSPTSGGRYRDRAKERREKFGIVPPTVNTRKVDVPPPIFEPVPLANIPTPLPVANDAPNVGNLLMQKMGWQAGQGLGRANQGRTELVEAEFREAGVGLGIKPVKRQTGDNYQNNAKRAMYARYHEDE